MKNKKITNLLKLNLFKKLVIVSLLIVIVPVTIIGVIGSKKFSDTISDETINHMQSRVQGKLTLLKANINSVKIEASSYASENDIINALNTMDSGSSSQVAESKQYLKDYLTGIHQLYDGKITDIFIIDKDGFTVADVLFEDRVGSDTSEMEYFIKARDTKQTFITDVKVSAATKARIMVAAVPIYSQNETFLGVLAMSLNYDSLVNNLITRDEGEKYSYMIFNSEGYIIAHENKDLLFQANMTNESPSQKKLFDKMLSTPTSYGEYTFNGVTKEMAYTTYEENNWIIGCSITKEDYLNPIRQLMIRIFLISIASVIVCGIIVFFFSGSISKPLKKLTAIASAISEGDLTQEVPEYKRNDELGKLAEAFLNMLEKLRKIIYEVREMSMNTAASSQEMLSSTEEVSIVSNQIATAVNELAKGSSEQASSTEQGNSRIIDLVSGLNNITTDMIKSDELVNHATDAVEEGKTSMQYQTAKMAENQTAAGEVAASINDMSDKASEIGDILGVIRSISEQTNLLSLNATIEAARAGEQGKGFAVVASEIRKLAEQSDVSVQKIEMIITEVQESVTNVSTAMDNAKMIIEEQEKASRNTQKAFHNVDEIVTNIYDNIQNVTKETKLLDKKAKETGEIMGDIASISEESASGAQEVAASSEEQTAAIEQITNAAGALSELAGELQKSIEMFKI